MTEDTGAALGDPGESVTCGLVDGGGVAATPGSPSAASVAGQPPGEAQG